MDSAYLRLISNYTTQKNQTYCGVASSVMVLNALHIHPKDLLFGKYAYFDQDNFFTPAILQQVSLKQIETKGLTLDQLGMIWKNYPLKVSVVHAQPKGYDEFEHDLQNFKHHPDQYLIINFLRTKLGQAGGGHFSPIAAYDPKTNEVLLVDVARYKYLPYWVGTHDLWEAMTTIDSDSKKNRGYILIQNG